MIRIPLIFLSLAISVNATVTEVSTHFNSGAGELTDQYNATGSGVAPSLTWSAAAGVGGSGGITISPGDSSGAFYGPNDADYAEGAFDFSDNAVGEIFRANLDFRFNARTFEEQEFIEIGFSRGPGAFFNGLPSASARIQFANEDNFSFFFQTRGNGGATNVVNSPILGNDDFEDGHWYRIVLAFSPANGNAADRIDLFGSIRDLGLDGQTPGDLVASMSRTLTSTSSSFQAEDEFLAWVRYTSSGMATGTYVGAIDNWAFTDDVEIPLPTPPGSTISDGLKQAWSANSGWVNFKPDETNGVIVTETLLSGYAYNANVGWLRLGDGQPSDGIRYANAAGEFGVNHSYSGDLSGYAWSANSGWVNFGWGGLNDPNRARLNLLTGDFAGYAWSANLGWLNLGSGNLQAESLGCPDLDQDGIGDAWEREHFGNLATASIGTDQDGDGQSDAAEFVANTDPNDGGSFVNLVTTSFAEETGGGLFYKNTLEIRSSPGRTYAIEMSTDLGISDPWTDSGLGLFLSDPSGMTLKEVITSKHEHNFFRLRISKPLSN